MTRETQVRKKISSAAPFYDESDIDDISHDITKILKSKRLVLGPFTKKFEELFAEHVGTKHAVAVSSATAGLEAILTYAGIEDSEVIVPTNTFIACPNSVIYAGGKPVFADMNPDSFCLDINDVVKKITPRTKAIMVVHLAGLPEPEMDALSDICHDHKIFLMEDCSHAHGASFKGKKVGSLAEAGCFSLFATKIMAIGTGGIITTDDEKLKLFAEALRHQGGIGGEGQIEVFDKFGYDWMMNEVTAALAINQLAKLEKQLEIRRRIAEQYRYLLNGIDRVKIPPKYRDSDSSYWKFIVVLDDSVDRNKVREIMRREYNIDAGILYPTLCHMQPIYQNLGHKEGECPIAENIMRRQLTLPINPYMTQEEIEDVVHSLEEVIQRT